MGTTYFAFDGSYGDAEHILIVDTTNWTQDDWDLVTWARDGERAEVACEIEAAHRKRGQLELELDI